MRTLLVATCAASLLAFVALAPAHAADGSLTGKMAPFNYLIGGTWTCSTKMSAMGGRPASSGHSTVTFDVVPSNAFHDHVASPEYADDDYYGYDAKSATFWNSSADNFGGHQYATSKDGVTYDGTSWERSSTTSVVSTYKKVTPTKVLVHEVLTSKGHTGTFDATCTK